MHSLDPKRVVQQTWSSLKSRRGDESCRRNHNSDRLADDPFPSISKGLSVAPPSSDVIRTSYPRRRDDVWQPLEQGFGFRNSKTRSDPGGGHRRTSNRRRQGPHACEPASLL